MTQEKLEISLFEMFNSKELGGRYYGRLIRDLITQLLDKGLNVLLNFSEINLVM